jgi:hypothetical protein
LFNPDMILLPTLMPMLRGLSPPFSDFRTRKIGYGWCQIS